MLQQKKPLTVRSFALYFHVGSTININFLFLLTPFHIQNVVGSALKNIDKQCLCGSSSFSLHAKGAHGAGAAAVLHGDPPIGPPGCVSKSSILEYIHRLDCFPF